MTRENIIQMTREIATQACKAGPYRTWTHDYAMTRIMYLIDASAAAERDRMCKQFNIPKELAHEKAKNHETD